VTSDAEEILSALIDREAVDADELARVLEQPRARSLLVDFVRLRAMLSHDSQRSHENETTVGTGGLRRQAQWSVHPLIQGRWGHAAAAAMLTAAGLSVGVWLGHRQVDGGPPTPIHTVQFQPGVEWQVIEALPRQRR
jgi:hypothetical protein